MIDNPFDIDRCLFSLQKKRPIFHSEADFQFALSWEIKSHYPDANVRLEYCPSIPANVHIDILLFYHNETIPIELKYKTAKLTFSLDNEDFNLKNHGAQDLGKYDFLKDVQRLEDLSSCLSGFSKGYTVWLTNDTSYWNPPSRKNTVYEAFSIHQSARKHGCMEWLPHAGAGTIKGREKPITLNGTYVINWRNYSDIGCKKGIFKYATLTVTK